MRASKVLNPLHNCKVRICFRIIIGVVVLIVGLMILRGRIISYKCNYGFFPRGDLNEAYRDDISHGSDSKNIATEVQDYLQYLKECYVIGTVHSKQIGEYGLGFGMYEPTCANDKFRVLFD